MDRRWNSLVEAFASGTRFALRSGDMHFVAFRLKRAHQASLRIAREIAGRCGLTPARFDLLYVIWKDYAQRPSQKAIRRALGVARSTVSRMLTSLENLGIVKRGPKEFCFDRRSRCVSMTPAGRSLFLKLLHMVEKWDEMQLAYEVALRSTHGESTYMRIHNLYGAVCAIAEEFGDTGRVRYPTAHDPYWKPTRRPLRESTFALLACLGARRPRSDRL